MIKAIFRALFGPKVIPGQIWELDNPHYIIVVEVLTVENGCVEYSYGDSTTIASIRHFRFLYKKSLRVPTGETPPHYRLVAIT